MDIPSHDGKSQQESHRENISLESACNRLLLRFAEKAKVTHENGFDRHGDFPNSYSSLPLKHNQLPSMTSSLDETKPPFLTKHFNFMILRRLDQPTQHPELQILPQTKIIIPVDERRHFGYGKIEYFQDIDGQWKVITQDHTPAEEIVKQIISGQKAHLTSDEKGLAIAQALRDIKENAALELEMRQTRELTDDEMAKLHILLQNPTVLEKPSFGNFHGSFATKGRPIKDYRRELERRRIRKPPSES